MEFEKIKQALGDGLLSFPITDMDDKGNFNPSTFEDRVNWFLEHQISALFVAGGTGEFFSLSKGEYQQIISIAAKTVEGKAPVISSVGRSIPEAIEFAKLAEESGIDGLLLMPPYLTGCPKSGVVSYAKAIMQSTRLPVIYYNRANGILGADEIKELADVCPNLIALKDGTGNMQDLNETIKTVGDRLVYIGGVPTAEIISEAYLSIGVNTYSSAVFNFVPEMAIAYYEALRAGNQEKVNQIISDFFIPFVRLRSKKSGYAVSLIKAGAEIIGKPAGDVRAPLEMPSKTEKAELKKMIEKAQTLL
ncbi:MULTISPECIES: 5-dehydro-4-deoxyglucarate dehydratase [Flavobacteriaceae]|uniref:5-dehydro-4-deoxyglucarate dehydratase n=1 Tax=Flavobacteriaceae TaxID=49546 RepID=UPI001490A9A9|nr:MULTISPECIES: 5-dehydro-4-deoxyglucarate dehydratase [Allomuricauda]MDC6365920.1 5-dehydro-4-deoxyglucarate dehydratase [Muricauda sp. AC10]